MLILPMNNIIIKDATPENSELIAEGILAAIGEELTMNLAGGKGREVVKQLFSRLAVRRDSQYSFMNSRIAYSDKGEPMGVCISYDGADLIPLRRQFFKEARETLNWEITEEEVESLPGETSPDEFYLDTLMTLPHFRGRGVGKALIIDAFQKAKKYRKPLGLLCDIDNHKARKLYESLGFQNKGKRPFAGHIMDHLLLIPHGL